MRSRPGPIDRTARRKVPWLLPRDDEAAVSSVLGAILVFGLLVLTLTVVNVEFVPVWDKQRESDQSSRVAGQANAIKADLDRIAAGQVDAALSEPISLVRSRGFTFFGSEVVPGTVRFSPTSAGAGFTVLSNHSVALQQSQGEALFGLNENWGWNGTPAKFNILDIVHLRIRIPAPVGLPTSPTPTFTFTLADVNGNCAGQLQLLANGPSNANKTFEMRVFPAQPVPTSTCSATPVDIHTTYLQSGAAPAYYYIEPIVATEFGAVMAAIAPDQYPLSASFTRGTTSAEVAMVFDENTAFGRVRSGAVGLVFSSLNEEFQTGTLTIGLNHVRLPAQTYAFEYGAVILEQAQGAAIVAPPGFTVSTTIRQAALSWAFPVLTGGASAISGAPAATVTMLPNGEAGMQLTGRSFNITLETAYPQAWVDFWVERMALAGLSATPLVAHSDSQCADLVTAAAQYAVSSTPATPSLPGTASLLFNGPCAADGDTVSDILLTVLAGGATIALQPAG